MKRYRRLPIIFFSLLLGALASCGASNSRTSTPASDAAAAAPAPQLRESAKCLGDSAELFENLTELAATAPSTLLHEKSAASSAKAEECAHFLMEAQKIELKTALAGIGKFETGADRTDLALNAVEAYRIMVTAKPRAPGDAPLAVSLLDYAGFRYQAGAKSSPPRWDDMTSALDFADERWISLAPEVRDSALASKFADGLKAMRAALQSRDAAAAQSAAAAELDQVDLLENYFMGK